MPVKKGQSSKHEGESLEIQAHIVKAKRKQETLFTLLKNALMQLNQQGEDLDKATEANAKIRKPKP